MAVITGGIGSFNLGGGTSFGGCAASIEAFTKKTIAKSESIIQRSVMEVFKRIVMRTPIDTGRARAGWQVGETAAISSPLGAVGPIGPKGKSGRVVQSRALGGKWVKAGRGTFDKRGQATIASGRANIKAAFRDGIAAIISNPVYYVVYLEYGHSQAQAPAGMVRITMAEWPSIVASFGGVV